MISNGYERGAEQWRKNGCTLYTVRVSIYIYEWYALSGCRYGWLQPVIYHRFNETQQFDLVVYVASCFQPFSIETSESNFWCEFHEIFG